MWAPGQALPTAFTGRGIVLFPPVACTADQVVTLLCKSGELVADGQIAQTQEFGNRNLLWAGEARLTLLALLLAKPCFLSHLCR